MDFGSLIFHSQRLGCGPAIIRTQAFPGVVAGLIKKLADAASHSGGMETVCWKKMPSTTEKHHYFSAAQSERRYFRAVHLLRI